MTDLAEAAASDAKDGVDFRYGEGAVEDVDLVHLPDIARPGEAARWPVAEIQTIAGLRRKRANQLIERVCAVEVHRGPSLRRVVGDSDVLVRVRCEDVRERRDGMRIPLCVDDVREQ